MALPKQVATITESYQGEVTDIAVPSAPPHRRRNRTALQSPIHRPCTVVTEVASLVRFGDFTLSADSFELRRGTERVPLQRIPLELLIILAKNRGALVSREEIIETLWGKSVFIDAEHSINTAIKKVRAALGDDPENPRYVQTVVGKGYRFIAPVEECSHDASPALAEPSVETVSSSPTSAARRTWFGAPAAIFAIVIIVLLATALTKMGTDTRSPLKLSKILIPGNAVVYGVSSPDGTQLAYVSFDAAGESLWVRPLKSSGNGIKIASSPLGFWGVTFSPDGRSIYYVLGTAGPLFGTLWRIPVVGGDAEKLPPGINGAVQFSPDARSMIFKRAAPDGGMSLVTADLDGRNERVLATSTTAYPFYSYDWQRDGKSIVFSEGAQAKDKILWAIFRLSASDGIPHRVTELQPNAIKSVVVRHDGSLAVIETDEESNLDQIWCYTMAGQKRRITNDTNSYVGLSSFLHENQLLGTQWQTEDLLWVTSAQRDLPPSKWTGRQITPHVGNYGSPVWTPQGRIVFTVGASLRATELWSIDADGSDGRLLVTGGSYNFEPAVSPDGRFVAFVSRRNGATSVWRVDMDGSDLRRVTSGSQDIDPAISPSARWIVYASYAAGKWQIMRIAADGSGKPDVIGDGRSVPIVSPDEKLVAHEFIAGGVPSRTIAIRSFPDGKLLSQFPVPPSATCFGWSTDGKAITYLVPKGDSAEFHVQPVTGGPARLQRILGPRDIFHVNLSPDGQRFVLLRRRLKAELIVLENAS